MNTHLTPSISTLLTAVGAVTAAVVLALSLAEPAQLVAPQQPVEQLERVVVVGKRMHIEQLPRVVVEGRRFDGQALAQANLAE